MGQLLTQYKLMICLGLSILFCLTFLAEWQTIPVLLAQTSPIREPASTPVIGDIYIDAQFPRPPTPLPTPVPDFEPPVTHLTVKGIKNTTNWYRTPVTLLFDSTDNMEKGGTWYKFKEDKEWQLYEYYQPPLRFVFEGKRKLYYYSEDRNRNTEVSRTLSLNIDLTPPKAQHTLSINDLTANSENSSFVTIDFSGQDNLSGVEYFSYQLDNSDWITITTSLVITTVGHHTLKYRAVDRAGNMSETETLQFVAGETNALYLPLIIKQE